MKLFKGTKIYSILGGVCPVCHEESMYKEPNPYKITKIMHMHERCSNCGTKYKIEPSFFYGAMYVSYPVGIAFATAAFVIAYYMLNVSLLNSFFVIVATMIVFMPLIMRLSRNIWINFFFSYDKQKAKH
ncbi:MULTISPECIES: DUF983 domain-containing protein [Croceibacter]|jgi:uncharacterized protein (DUF983 family)|uniref:DUF983 domain-containing protein n=1 Tax=Croceibacter atlanticus (strain ATCC BAA-628 / JCM 21780 / CIP 108009 / IAM 15332 / KCTC 12090 / HTCC2559) TaxID=216432 RepID=A3U5B4_CROAH|nr:MULTISPECIES: DUF983 domain-containing protein [Croceibacter]HAT69296.1 DUF983 domain-containing protein [Flavobacteriaceae bacterium]EAP87431.1 hypothetical protein CA2559_01710 [Croceibacter atlanticus HTCC2559]MAM22839.1 DUF983 domain-containing protein [Croceibacter sp.]MBG25880.1 DUF983 domain-containing protein [Croceibacter sp.]WSP35104.1 DUF983 domain-containing protein [Croceibacter atlanticus]|tara:strand:+ start:2378 stop:2764 length:387 start_codon:yes stop_codon:yes gene_type:complete